jgi:murein DD-endopeptidase MepM/ murein hydrolase activator NlpD
MKRSGLPAFAAVIALATILVSPPLPGVEAGSAWAQTTTPTPTPTPPPPEPAPAPEPEPPEAPAPANPAPGSGGSAPAPQPAPPSPSGGSSAGGGGSHGGSRSNGGGAPATTETPATIWWSQRPSYSGGYSTSSLVAQAARLRANGASAQETNKVYAPFIIAGRAEWSDTFGGIRHASDSGWRPHLGQDVFCDYGAPVLASEHGRVSYGSDATGGLVARVHRSDGSYWYYAHLSSFSNSVSSGEAVSPGDVIGYCGNTGNAVGSAPHVHFGFYSGGVALNPMGALIQWLNTAESEAAGMSKKPARRAKTEPKEKKEPKPPPTLPRTGPAVDGVCEKKSALVTDLLVIAKS